MTDLLEEMEGDDPFGGDLHRFTPELEFGVDGRV